MTPLRWAIVSAAFALLMAFSLLPGRSQGATTTHVSPHLGHGLELALGRLAR
jgi:hypothetical protein